MQRNVWRAFLLAMTMLIVGALPAMAQAEETGWLLSSDDDNVLIAAGRDITVGPTETADGVVVINGQALIEGAVDGLFAVDADVVLSGASANVDSLFIIGGTLEIGPGASVSELTYTGTEPSIDATATVGTRTNAEEELAGALGALVAFLIVAIFFLVIGAFIAWLAMTLLVIAFGTAQVRRAAATISNDVLKTIVVGLLMLILPSIIFGLLFITIVGIPLAIVLLLLWGVVVALGQIVVGVWIGERILPRGRTANRPYGAAFLGMLILLLLSWTGIVPLLAGIFGTGAVTLAGWRVLRGGGAPPVPPGYYGEPWGQPMMVPPPPYAPPPYAPPPPPQQGQWPPQGGQPPSAWPQG